MADGTPVYLFGFQPAIQGELMLFGDTFLRSAYILYDLDNLHIGIASTNFENTSSKFVEIQKDGTSGGAAHTVADVTAVQTGTGIVAPGCVGEGSNATVLTAVPTVTTGVTVTGIKTSIKGVGTDFPGLQTWTSAAGSAASATSSAAAAAMLVTPSDGVPFLVPAMALLFSLVGGAFMLS